MVVQDSTILPFQALKVQNTIVTNNASPSKDHVKPSVISSLAAPGFASKYDVAIKGKPMAISYNIIGGSLVGILADPSRNSLDLAINPSSDDGAIEIQLPRQVIDSKGDVGKDAQYRVVMDGARISGEPTGICVGTCPNIFNSFKETENTNRPASILNHPF